MRAGRAGAAKTRSGKGFTDRLSDRRPPVATGCRALPALFRGSTTLILFCADRFLGSLFRGAERQQRAVRSHRGVRYVEPYRGRFASARWQNRSGWCTSTTPGSTRCTAWGRPSAAVQRGRSRGRRPHPGNDLLSGADIVLHRQQQRDVHAGAAAGAWHPWPPGFRRIWNATRNAPTATGTAATSESVLMAGSPAAHCSRR